MQTPDQVEPESPAQQIDCAEPTVYVTAVRMEPGRRTLSYKIVELTGWTRPPAFASVLNHQNSVTSSIAAHALNWQWRRKKFIIPPLPLDLDVKCEATCVTRQVGTSIPNTRKQQSLAVGGGRKQRRRGTRKRATGSSAGRGARCISPGSQITTVAARNAQAPKNLPDRTGHTSQYAATPLVNRLMNKHSTQHLGLARALPFRTTLIWVGCSACAKKSEGCTGAYNP